jgi:hypothetical protein
MKTLSDRQTRIFGMSLASLVVLGSIQVLGADDPNGKSNMSDNENASAREQSVSRIIVSKETTHVLGPLHKDGSVDFLAAINERSGKGVTPANNAAIAYWRLIGPAAIPEPHREPFFRAMGIAPLPAHRDYFLPMDEFYRRHLGVEKLTDEQQAQEARDLSDPCDSAAFRPWSAAEFPLLAKWLEANTAALDRFIADSKTARFYSPLYFTGSVDRPMSMFSASASFASRGVASALRLRATMRLKAGQIDEALNDCLAAHRLARHIGQGPYVVDVLVAIAVEGVACSADWVVAEYVKLSATQAKKYQSDLGGLPSLPRIIDASAGGERLFALNTICCLARQDAAARREWAKSSVGYAGLLPDDDDVRREAAIIGDAIINEEIDWNEVLRLANRWTDRAVLIYKRPGYQERRVALERLWKDFVAIKNELWNSTIDGRDQRRNDATLRAANASVSQTMSPNVLLNSLDEVSATRVDLSKLAVALAAYRTDHGVYPSQLPELAPKYIGEVPRDRFSAGELHYKLVHDGYLLYSVGPNETDDGGRDIHDEPEGDDIRVRMPQKRDAK